MARTSAKRDSKAAAGNDPEAQAEAILSDSDERTDDPAGTQQESTQSPNVS